MGATNPRERPSANVVSKQREEEKKMQICFQIYRCIKVRLQSSLLDSSASVLSSSSGSTGHSFSWREDIKMSEKKREDLDNLEGDSIIVCA